MTTLQDLRAKQEELRLQQEEIARSIDAMKSEQRSNVIAEIKALMAQHNLTPADLEASTRPSRAGGEAKVREVSKVAVKYRHADTGETWTGRGLKPRWLAAAIESGRSIEEFLVESPTAS
ncbi:MAG: hypothetical protein RLZZ592_2989 [Pseudomonadota bacterium]|jgi:DNA-binding protein H-NS|nr:DNA-binding protein [Pseudomonadota bacterium]